jgi:DnaJ-like protein
MPFRRTAENRIREAIAEGKFENLARAGEPLNLDEYFSTPEDLRMAYSILKNAKCPPAEVELLNEIARLKEALARADDETTRQPLHHALARRQTELAILLERRRAHTDRR